MEAIDVWHGGRDHVYMHGCNGRGRRRRARDKKLDMGKVLVWAEQIVSKCPLLTVSNLNSQ
jgi:hypothetical protein